MFLDTIDGNIDVISNAFESDNIRLYTIKVHALKSSARIVGAKELSKLAAKLEEAGNNGDKAFIEQNTGKLLTDYKAYKDKLKRLNENFTQDENDGREMISEEDLKDAYAALAEILPQMDYDAVELLLGQLKEYRLPPEDAKKMNELERLLKTFDWDAMEELFNLS
jgi:HPt (histidine-containing phosphotransfer) domain-containing protein